MGGKKSTSTSSVSIPPEVLARYNAVNQRAETAASTPYHAFGNQASDFVAQMNAQQNAGISDINATAGSYQPYMTQATAATQAGMGPAYEGINNYMSPYVKNVADTTGAYMRQQAEQAQSGALGNAISSGAFGGDRAGIAAANLQQQNQMGYGKTMADIMNQGYTQALGASQADLARQLQGGAQMAGLGAQSQQLGLQGAQAKIAAGTMQQQTEQAGKDAMINQFMQEKGYPFQTAQFLANIAMGTGTASGSTTSTTTPRNWMGFASGGGVSGYADGGGVSGPRTYTKEGIGGESYVPAGDLPVGQLMVADVPEQQQGSGTEDIVKLIAMLGGGAKNGGAIDQRHGYATDGAVSYPAMTTDELRRIIGVGIKNPSNEGSLMRAPTNPANMGLAGHAMPASPTTGVAAPVSSETVTSMRPPARPEGLGAASEPVAPTTSMRPPARPTGLGAANVTPAVTAVATPAVTPAGGVGGADVAADAMKTLKVTDVAPTAFDIPKAQPVTLGSETKPAAADPVDFFNTKIIRQESGDNQFDSKGNPLTSSAGAVGVAQVMEGTGPEAARLAGLEWDRNRWLNDKEYNKALGQAYFLEQYRKFGSLDKAAAAYNAGPGALASAMDRATALGGSYLDYLPAETQNYVYSTTGMGSAVDTGGLGGGRNVSGDGLAGADMTRQRDGLFANDKPYEDRNAIGKFFYNPNGSLNQNALLSVLMGVGKAAEAQTISPLGGILSGIGGGAEAYKGLTKQAADVAATNIANIKEINRGTIAWNAMPGNTPVTTAEYARMVGMPVDAATQRILEGMSAGAAKGGNSYLGAPLDPFGMGMSANVTRPDGTVVKAYNDIGYLQHLLAEQQPMVAAGVISPEIVTQTENRIQAIKDAGGRVPVEGGNGGTAIDPIYAEQQAAAVASERGAVLLTTFPELEKDAQEKSTAVNQLVDTISAANATGKTGMFSNLYSQGSAFWEAVGGGPGNYASLNQEVIKSLAGFMAQKTGESPTDLERQIRQSALPDLAKQPAANAWVLATMQAQTDRENARVQAIASSADPQSAYENEQMAVKNFDLEAATRQHYEENLAKFGAEDPAKIEISAATTIGPNGVVPPNLVGIVSQPQWNAATKEDVAVLLGQPQVAPSSTVDPLPEVNNPMGN